MVVIVQELTSQRLIAILLDGVNVQDPGGGGGDHRQGEGIPALPLRPPPLPNCIPPPSQYFQVIQFQISIRFKMQKSTLSSVSTTSNA